MATPEHRVATHLGLAASDYDAEIRRYLPAYDAMIETEALFAQWAGEDRYYPLAVELELLRAAGFAQPDCFWKQGPATVFGGFR